MRITSLVRSWLKGEKANRGFLLMPELVEERTKFSIASRSGVKAQLYIYYTGPEVVPNVVEGVVK